MEPTLIIASGALTRLVSLGIGAFFVYLGYRLFSQIPLSAEGGAEISGIHGATIKLTRIGPGVFFALFGALIVVWTLAQPIEYQATTRLADGAVISEQAGAAGDGRDNDEAMHSRRGLVAQDIEFLNQLGRTLSPQQAAALRHAPDYILPRIKLLLMQDVWDRANWGEAQHFASWLERTGGLAPPDSPQTAAALAFYNALPGTDE